VSTGSPPNRVGYCSHLEESNLVLELRVRSVGCRSGHRKVVVNVTGVDRGVGLGENLRTLHRLAVPERGAILMIVDG
jgi:hypothetical protein